MARAARVREPDRRERNGAGDGKCERRPADLREPAGEQSADGREPEEREEVEPDQSSTQVVGRGELDERVRIRREQRESDADSEEQRPREIRVVDGGE